MIALFFVPESPKFSLMFRDDKQRALLDLSRLRGCAAEQLEDEFDLLQKSQENLEVCSSTGASINECNRRMLPFRTKRRSELCSCSEASYDGPR